MPVSPQCTRVTVDLPEELFVEMKNTSLATHKSISELVREALSESFRVPYLSKAHRKQYRLKIGGEPRKSHVIVG